MLEQLFTVSIAMSAIILLMIILSSFFKKRYTAKLRYGLWIIIAVRLLLPFHIQLPSQEALIRLHIPQAAVSESVQTAPANTVQSEHVQMKQEQKHRMTAHEILLLIWGGGASVFLAYHVFAYVQFRRKIKPWCIAGGISYIPPVLICKKIASPMLLGFFKPVILLPDIQYTQQELAVILSHEQAHYNRRDIWYKLILVITNAVHWFNPFVYAMVHYAVRDLEFSCDDIVTQNQDIEFRKTYSNIILNTAINRTSTPLSTYFRGGKKSMKQRFSNILDMNKKKRGILMFSLICALSIVGTVLFSVTGNANSQADAIFKKLSAYLPNIVIDDLDTFREEEQENGSTFYIWSKWDDAEESFVHDIQVTAQGEFLLSYHYKDYGFTDEHLTKSNITKEAAEIMAKNFVEAFTPNGKNLLLKNKPAYYSLYDPGHVESWVAEDESGSYIVMINLDYGYVEYYRYTPEIPSTREQVTAYLENMVAVLYKSYGGKTQLTVSAYQETIENGSFKASLSYQMRFRSHYTDSNYKKTGIYVIDAIISANYHPIKETNHQVEVTAVILDDGTLDPMSISCLELSNDAGPDWIPFQTAMLMSSNIFI